MLHMFIYGISVPLLTYIVAVWAVMGVRSFFALIFYVLYRNKRDERRFPLAARVFGRIFPDESLPGQTTAVYPPPRRGWHNVSVIITVTPATSAEDFGKALSSMVASLKRSGIDYEVTVILDAVDNPREICYGDSPRRRALREVLATAGVFADRVYVHGNRSKRMALAFGIRRARYPLLALMDDDTMVDPAAVREALRFFNHPKVGGVTTAQRVWKPKTLMQNLADWLENARLYGSMAAMSLFGQVGCLPGRLYFVRKELILPRLDEFVNDWAVWPRRVLRKPGDDRWITMAVMKAGYWTLLAPDSRVWTLAPATLRETIPQQRRWAVSSQWYTIESLPWLWRFPMTFFVYISDMLVITLGTVAVVAYWIWQVFTGSLEQSLPVGLAIALTGMSLTVAIRQLPHLRRNWRRDWKLIPLFALYALFLQLDARFRGLVWPVWDRWQTRGVDRTVKETRFTCVHSKERRN